MANNDDEEATKQRVQNATLMRTLRQSRKSRLTPEELAAVYESLCVVCLFVSSRLMRVGAVRRS